MSQGICIDKQELHNVPSCTLDWNRSDVNKYTVSATAADETLGLLLPISDKHREEDELLVVSLVVQLRPLQGALQGGPDC